MWKQISIFLLEKIFFAIDLIWRSEKIIKFGVDLIWLFLPYSPIAPIFLHAKIYPNKVVLLIGFWLNIFIRWKDKI